MTDKAKKTLHIKLVRSGIAFSHRQKVILRSLGLGKLNRVVERPDTPQIRGLVASVPRLVEVVEKPARPAWMQVAEYSIKPPEVAPPAATESSEAKAEESPAAPEASAATKSEPSE